MAPQFDFFAYLASASVRSLGLAFLAWAGIRLFRIKSASLRHALWTLVIGLMAMQVLIQPVLPPVPIRILTPVRDAGPDPLPALLVPPPASLSNPNSRGFTFPSWQEIVEGVYVAGALALFARLLFAFRFTRVLVGGSRPISDLSIDSCPLVRESERISVPMTTGHFRPAILLPLGWRTWDEAKLKYVIAHEEAHVRRADWAIGVLSQVNCCVFWFHPLAWWLKKEVASLAEFACDDSVLEQAGDRWQYAQALIEIAAAMKSAQGRLVAMSMAKESNVERRLNQILDDSRKIPSSLGRRGRLGLLLGSIPLAYVVLAVQLAPAQVRLKPSIAPANAPRVEIAQARPSAPARPTAPAVSSETPYQKWLNDEVTYIISDEERRAFLRLATEDERQMFIEQFWLRRDPTPGTSENEMKEEHYRRIAYTNDRFSAGIDGWKTDRGAVYIKYGPPDSLDSHGATATTYPYETWRYRNISGFGADVEFEFVDPTMTGRYHLTLDPAEKERSR